MCPKRPRQSDGVYRRQYLCVPPALSSVPPKVIMQVIYPLAFRPFVNACQSMLLSVCLSESRPPPDHSPASPLSSSLSYDQEG